jgi:hypothetical protein
MLLEDDSELWNGSGVEGSARGVYSMEGLKKWQNLLKALASGRKLTLGVVAKKNDTEVIRNQNPTVSQ